ncbi:hypothetical protein EJ357_22670 [Streptomyces cyaneochromogenes]|uniref:Uncharacterized protein n=1 Tax=Streptomyces cyaneochromogenes TaxID=2496836 RepID=A0A3S9M9P0_9ACTN|nr:hypothetical protein [Streptomyces cyaneochromogenes]AZQ35937.1 hypothetical protein EJ357_22670 [Streptomyces cyaneochromogenes]
MASVAVWWRGRASVAWQLQQDGRSRHGFRAVNIGDATAKSVHVRVGSASDPTNVEDERRAESVSPSESVRIPVATDSDSREDVAVVITWDGRPWGRETWTYPLR